MINQSWNLKGNLITELSTLFNHRRMQDRVFNALLYVNPIGVNFVRQDDFFMMELVDKEPGVVWYGFAKRNPLDPFSVHEAKKIALYRIVKSIEESLGE